MPYIKPRKCRIQVALLLGYGIFISMTKNQRKKYSNLIGTTVGSLQIIKFAIFCNGIRERPGFYCKCSCGKFGIYKCYSVANGDTPSCGCKSRDRIIAFNKYTAIHGMSNTPEFEAYCQARKRCNNKKHKFYAYYGGRGIKFNFLSFEDFYNELGNKPNDDYQLDRINNNGHYEIGNVRWATRSENCLNRRNSLKNKL